MIVMKRLLLYLLGFMTVFLLTACGKQVLPESEGEGTGGDTTPEVPLPPAPADPLRILFIGNSLTVDATEYLPKLLVAAGIRNVYMARAYHGGYTVSGYNTNFTAAKICGVRYCGPGDLYWRGDDTLLHSLAGIVGEQEWGIITIQPHSAVEMWEDKDLESNVRSLISKIKAVHPDHVPAIGLNYSTVYAIGSSTLVDYFGNDQTAMYDACTKVCRHLMEACDIDFLMPSATAMQNLRSSQLNIPNGQDLSRDLIHVDYGIGRYTLACSSFGAIFEPRFDIKAEDLAIRMDWECRHPSGYATPVTYKNYLIAQKSARAAVDNPYSVTSMASEPLGTVPDASLTPAAEDFHTVSFPVEFPLGFGQQGYRFHYDKQASWRSEGIWFCQDQPYAYARMVWGPRYEGETLPYFLETISTSSKIGSPGFKGLWTGDCLEFNIPVASLPSGSVINLSFPLYGRQQPAFWDIEWWDEGKWKCNRSARTAGGFTCSCTFVSNLYSTQVSEDMVFSEGIRNGFVRVRLKVADGRYQNDTSSGKVVERSTPFVLDGVYGSPVYFYGGNAVETLRFVLK